MVLPEGFSDRIPLENQSDQQAGVLHVAMTRAKKTLELDSRLTTFTFEQWGTHRSVLRSARPPSPSMDLTQCSSRFHLLDDTKERTPCSKCQTLSSHDLIGHSTPLPYHPDHTPTFPSDLSSGVHCSISPADFPICTTCALNSEHPPLRDLASFAEGRAVTEDDIETNDTDDFKDLHFALANRKEMKESRARELELEMRRTKF